MASAVQSDKPQYIYNLPFAQRSELCKILNQSEKWEELAGMWMNYDMLTIQNLRKEKNPTDELLTLWSIHNHTILELFVLLSKMQHYRAMIPLKSFVDTKYHVLIDRGEGNVRNAVALSARRRIGSIPNTKDSKIGTQNFNRITPPRVVNLPKIFIAKDTNKILNQADTNHHQLSIGPSNSNNLLVPSPTPERINHVSQKSSGSTFGKPQNLNQFTSPRTPNLPRNFIVENTGKILNQADTNHHHHQPTIAPNNSNNLLVPSPTPERTNQVSQKLSNLTIGKPKTTLPQISYEELTHVTDGWNIHKILGKGGFGTVYHGTWKNTDVAIKKIERRGRESDDIYILQLQQSLREITILNSRPHENILPLYAFSIGGNAPCLVYQFMRNGSVEDRLLLRHRTPALTWLQRHEIAKGTARGLQYLHTIGDKPLIHGDIKSANILLDKNYEPRIGDFGLAREGPAKDSMKVSKIHGTRPYLPDEFLKGKILSTKVDTYSYGIVLFELATGLPAYNDSRSEHKFLKDFIDSLNEIDISLLIDKKAGDENNKVYQNLIALGRWCSNRLTKDRPEMELVFQKLNNL